MCQNWDKYRGCKAKENGCDECISFVRLKPQFCKRCGKDFIEHGEHLYCQNCREARLKQAATEIMLMISSCLTSCLKGTNISSCLKSSAISMTAPNF